MSTLPEETPPPPGTVERWAWEYVKTTDLSSKLTPAPPPSVWEAAPPSRRIDRPGRPPALDVIARAEKHRGVASPKNRARIFATFHHHELQAAELMLWALLRFSDAPAELRAGLLKIALDEIRHMELYRRHIDALGHSVLEFPVRDWFWQRVPSCQRVAEFLAVMGLGFESANLDHSLLWAERFRAVGDEAGALVQERVGAEEIAHARFSAHWLPLVDGPLTFDRWNELLPRPLSPMLMRGANLARDARARAGQPEAFLAALTAWNPEPSR